MDRSKQNFGDKKKAFTSIPKELLTIVPVSEWIHGEMKQSFLKDYPYQVIHNGINLENFQVYPADEVKKRYGLEGKRILLGVASIWMEEKGWNDFMQLAGMLNPDEVIVLVGVKEEQKKGLPATIVPISRTDNLKQLAELYAAAEALVNPTWQDNYPTVNLEAIACGTPVVTYRTGGSIEVITPDTGFIVEQGDIPGLLAAVRIIEERGKDYYQTKCRAYAEAHFRKEDRYADYLKLYENLTSR
jgi:glycosyltransferase involved in cell wall biosynthesis